MGIDIIQQAKPFATLADNARKVMGALDSALRSERVPQAGTCYFEA
jgi:hypothetical protein